MKIARNVPRGLLLALAASLALVSASGATEFLVEGFKLVVVDRPTSKKIVYLTKDPDVGVPTAGGADDPTQVEGSFTLKTFHVGGGDETVIFPLPEANWVAKNTSSGTLFKFVNAEAPSGPSAVKTVVLRNGVLKVKAREVSPITLDEGGQSQMGVRLDLGVSRWCSAFGVKITKNEPGIFVAKRQESDPGACISASPSGAFLDGTLP